MFLGIYDYTVILTYISLGISVFGITRALEGDFKVAIFCLAIFPSNISHSPESARQNTAHFGCPVTAQKMPIIDEVKLI